MHKARCNFRCICFKGNRATMRYFSGLPTQYATKAAAARAVQGLSLDLNNSEVQLVTVAEAAVHYRSVELIEASGKSQRTMEVYAANLDRVILPRWGACRLRDVKPVAVEQGLQSLPGAPGTKAKVRCVFSVLFQHAMRYEWAASNPVRLTRQLTASLKAQIVLELFEVQAILGNAPAVFWRQRKDCPGVALPRLSADDLGRLCKGCHRGQASRAGQHRGTARQTSRTGRERARRQGLRAWTQIGPRLDPSAELGPVFST